MKRISTIICSILFCVLLIGCEDESLLETNETEMQGELELSAVESSDTEESANNSANSDDNNEITLIPSKEEVLAMRELVLTGMTEDEKERLTENIKVANLQLESAYVYNNIFEKLSDKDSLYWNYFDQKGDIQIGWAYDGNGSDIKKIMDDENITQDEFYEKYGDPVIVYNRFDANNFIDLIKDMQSSVQDEILASDLQELIDLTELAAETHEMEYANEIYKILHDLDYFLLRYGIEDVGKYTADTSIVTKYYGVLNVYAKSNAESENDIEGQS